MHNQGVAGARRGAAVSCCPTELMDPRPNKRTTAILLVNIEIFISRVLQGSHTRPKCSSNSKDVQWEDLPIPRAAGPPGIPIVLSAAGADHPACREP